MKPASLRLISSRPDPLAKPRRFAWAVPGADRKRLGQILVDGGALDPGNLVRALAMQARESARLGDILVMNGWVAESDLLAALSRQWGADIIDTQGTPDPRLIDLVGPDYCLREGLLPWRQLGSTTLIAAARPADFDRHRSFLEERFGPVLMGLATESALHAALLRTRQSVLNRKAETRVATAESCRTWNTHRLQAGAVVLVAMVAAIAAASPATLGYLVLGWALFTLFFASALKLAAGIATLRDRVAAPPLPPSGPATIMRLPVVSLMLPMFNEPDIAPRLIERIGRLSYPRELLDVLLVVEEEDHATRQALRQAGLPRWMRVITVPRGPLKTKPRALNFALDFCRGSIIGIYDAEDAPAPDQIHRIVRRFHARGPEVACLQGVLDFYNPRASWLARCFTIEYACWFRVILPGLQSLGLAIPLGGTSLFFRRAALEALGGWDAHNVTEDADLGIRLARHGYRAELIHTVTEEEACARPWPWVRQRSRWLKGYAMTYAVHMRNPALLWRQLGAWRFLGVQVLFLGTLSQFLLAPLMWSFWVLAFGLWHPVAAALPPLVYAGMVALFVVSQSINYAVAGIAISEPRHRFLLAWVPTQDAYFLFGALAAYKALFELLTQPFFWDKTAHGQTDDPASLPIAAE